MERYAWKAILHDGKLADYKKRHDEIWPEMKQVLKEAGISNYTIWNTGNELFGYYECEAGASYAAKVQGENPIVAKWNEFMKDIMTMVMDEDTGAQAKLEQLFFLA